VQALDASAASSIGGVPLATPAWLYPGGGWVDPRRLCTHWLTASQARRRDAVVGGLVDADGRWQLRDAGGRVLLSASAVVLAGGANGIALLGPLARSLSVSRGQTSLWPPETPGLRAPALPIADSGYVLALDDGSVLCGATSDNGADTTARATDREANRQRLLRLTGSSPAMPLGPGHDWVGFRLATRDRLPLIGGLPADAGARARLDQPRFVPRAPALFVFSGLGSRGITWSALGARLLAAQVAGSPWPVESSLADAVDPARFIARAARERPPDRK
jgi:tRNA 5-methylaminomethyl-2-thiouridine biosynthesis bifunctional protein